MELNDINMNKIQRFIRSFVALLIGIGGGISYAQTSVSIGNADDYSVYPLGNYYGYEYSASIYLASEINTSGVITSLAWNSGVGGSARPIRVYLKDTLITGFSPALWTSMVSSAQLVFDGVLTPASGWNVIPITQFYHDNTKNLVVYVEANYGRDGNGEGSFGTEVALTYVSGDYHYYDRSDYVRPNGMGNINDERPDIKLELTPLTACTGTPVAGTIIASNNTPQAGELYSISAAGINIATGISYTWQSNTNNGGWVTINSGTTYAPLNNLLAPTFGTIIQYRLIAECTNSSLSDTSSILSVSSSYCVPVGYDPDYYIDTFVTTGAISNIANEGSGFSLNGFGDFTSQGVTIFPGGSFDIKVRFDEYEYYDMGFSIWVDWNNDGVYAPNEILYSTNTYTYAVDATVVVPSSVALGSYRMRILADYYIGSPYDPCTIYGYGEGEAEEYMMHIVAAPACSTLTPPNVNIFAGKSNVCISENIMVDIAGNAPFGQGLTYQWEVSSDNGTNWSNIAVPSISARDTILVNSALDVRLNILCDGVHWTYSANILNLDVINPLILTTVDSSRCGYGVVELNATSSPGTTIAWYDSLNATMPIFTGNTFITPAINTTTTYYAAAEQSVNTNWLGDFDAVTDYEPSPYDNAYMGVKNQYLIRATELNAVGYEAGNITALSFWVEYPGAVTLDNFTIKLGQTSLNSFGVNFEQGLTQVYTQSQYTPIGYTENKHEFQTPFTWDGVSNIIVETCFNNPNYTFNTPEVAISSYNYNTTIGFGDDINTVCSQPSALYALQERPDMYFTMKSCESPRVAVNAVVNSAPAIVASVDQASICRGTSVNLTVTSANSDYTYYWEPVGMSGDNITDVPNATTEYIVVAEDLVASSPNYLCAAIDTVVVNVDFISSYTLLATPDTVCSGENVNLAFTTVGVVGQGNDEVDDDPLNPFSYYFGGIKHQYLVLESELTALGYVAGQAISAIGFEFTNTTGQAFQGFNLEIGHTTVTDLNFGDWEYGLSSVYSNASVTPVVGQNMYNFTTPFIWDGVSNIVIQTCWSNNNMGDLSNVPTVKYDFTSFVATTYYQEDDAVSASICSSPWIDDEIYARPMVIFETSVNPSDYDYVWNPGGFNGVSAVVQPINTSNAIATETYTLTVDALNTPCSANFTVDVVVKPTPVAVITSDNTSICANNTEGFYIDASASSSNTSYLWLADSSVTPTYKVEQAGTYVLQVTNQFGCSDFDSLVVTSVQPIVPQVVVTGGGATLATLDAGSGFTSYLWTPNLEETQTITVGNGTYSVTTIDSNGCTATSASVVIEGVGLNENGTAVSIAVFPNPSNGIFTLQVGNLMEENMRIDIIDINGKIITNMNVKEIGKDYTQNIDLSNVAAGTYFIKLSTTKGSVTERIVIVR